MPLLFVCYTPAVHRDVMAGRGRPSASAYPRTPGRAPDDRDTGAALSRGGLVSLHSLTPLTFVLFRFHRLSLSCVALLYFLETLPAVLRRGCVSPYGY